VTEEKREGGERHKNKKKREKEKVSHDLIGMFVRGQGKRHAEGRRERGTKDGRECGRDKEKE